MSINKTLNASWAIIGHELKKTLKRWPQTLCPPAITSILYFVIFGHLIGNRIGTIDGVSYMQFIVPGLIMMNMLNATFNTAVLGLFLQKYNRSIEEIFVSPMSNHNIVISLVISGIIRGIMIGIIVAIIASVFDPFTIQHVSYSLLFVLLANVLFGLMGIIAGIYAKRFDQLTMIPMFIITPLAYLGGIFYPLNILPPFWQHIAQLNPLFYLITNFRQSFFGHLSIEIVISSIIMVVIGIILYCVIIQLIGKRVNL